MIIVENKPIDLSVVQNSYPAVRSILARFGVKVRTGTVESDNYSPGSAGWILRGYAGTIEALSIVAGNYIRTFVQAGVPTSDHIGDLWIKTDDNNKIYRAACVGADAIAAGKWIEYGTLANWTEIVGKPSNIFQIYYQATAPASGMSTGDYWIDSDDKKIYRYSGAAWVNTQDDDIATAITNAATAQSTADGKIYVYRQTSAPTGLGAGDAGDLWLDSDDSDKLYRWSGSAWTAAAYDVASWSKIVDDDGHRPDPDATENTGALADKDAVDLATGEVTNKDVDNITAGRLYECVVATSGGDYTTLTAAITAGKKRIFVRAGTYNIASNQNIPVDTKIYGEDWDKVVFNMQNAQLQLNADDIVLRDIQVSGYDASTFIISGTGAKIKIEHCRVSCPAATSYRSAIFISGNDFTLIDSEIKASSQALQVTGDDANIDRNRFISVLNTSTNITAMTIYLTGDDVLFTNNFLERTTSGNFDQGISASGDRVIIANNKIISDATYVTGITVSGVDTKIVNNHLVGWDNAIYLGSYYRQICSGNTVIDCGGHGIRMLGATNAGYGHKVITSNIIRNPGDDGISGGLTRNLIANNTIYNATNIGIDGGTGNTWYAIISNNKIERCGSHGIYLSGGTAYKAQFCAINGNNIESNTGTGIYADSYYSTFIGNVTYSNGTNLNITDDGGSEIAHNTS